MGNFIIRGLHGWVPGGGFQFPRLVRFFFRWGIQFGKLFNLDTRAGRTYSRKPVIDLIIVLATMVTSALSCAPSFLPLRGERKKFRRFNDALSARCVARKCTILFAANVQGPPIATNSRPVVFRVLITGSTKGLGLALAQRFLEAGDRVLVTSRDSGRVQNTVNLLQQQTAGQLVGNHRVCGTTADVSCSESVSALASFALEHMGGVDLWINNAGANGYVYENLAESDPAVVRDVVLTNSLGSLLCCREAIRMMSKQSGGGHIFNLLGAGSDGGATLKYAAYGHTKAGLVQLTKTLAGEVDGTTVRIHSISPGMVFTELISSGCFAFGFRGRFFVNTLAELPATAAEKIVTKVRNFVIKARAEKEGAGKGRIKLPPPFGVSKSATFEVLTPTVVLSKMFRRIVLGEGKDRYYSEDTDDERSR